MLCLLYPYPSPSEWPLAPSSLEVWTSFTPPAATLINFIRDFRLTFTRHAFDQVTTKETTSAPVAASKEDVAKLEKALEATSSNDKPKKEQQQPTKGDSDETDPQKWSLSKGKK